MAENVTGQIGSDQVTLENAATEATLKLLLQATLATTKEQRKAVTDLVQKAGLDPEKVEQANTGLSGMSLAAAKLGGALGGLDVASNSLRTIFEKTADITSKLTSGAGQASDIFGVFAGMGGTIGLVGAGFQKLAKFQEDQLKNYQEITRAGVSFGGSLTDMRMAASNMYLTMDQFTSLIKNNSESFAKMGGTADDGAKAFVTLSKALLSSEAGDNLRALGYTSEQVNQGLATYITMTGGRNKQEMSNTAALTASAAAYMTELDSLAEITGKTKDEQIAAGKEAAANQAWQSHLMTLTEEQKAKAEVARAEALARGGKGAEQALMSAAMGFPPMTKAAQEYTALAGNMNQVTLKQANSIKDNTKSIDDMKKGATAYNAASVKDKEALGVTADAIIMQGGALAGTAGAILGSANRSIQQGAETDAKAEAQLAVVDQKRKEREKSQADAAAKSQKALQEMGQQILTNLMPIVSELLSYMNPLVGYIADFTKYLAESPNLLKVLGFAVAGLTLLFVGMKVKAGISAVGGMLGGGKGGIAEAVTGGGGGGGAGKALGGVAEGMGKLGPMMGSLGKGAGQLFSGIMKGIATGLKAFADPLVIAGAAGFGLSIALIGAGIAGAAWLLGKALPTLAEGIGSFADMDGDNLVNVGLGIAALGAGLAVFGAGGVMGSIGGAISGLVDGLGSLVGVKSPVDKLKEFASIGPGLEQAGNGLQAFTTNMNALLNTDLSKISALTRELQKLKEASTPAEKGILATASDLVKSAITSTASPTEGSGSKGGPGTSDMSEILTRELKALNKQTETLVKAMREAADSTAKTASLIASNGNLFRA